MVPNSARSEVARAKPMICPSRAHRLDWVDRTQCTCAPAPLAPIHAVPGLFGSLHTGEAAKQRGAVYYYIVMFAFCHHSVKINFARIQNNGHRKSTSDGDQQRGRSLHWSTSPGQGSRAAVSFFNCLAGAPWCRESTCFRAKYTSQAPSGDHLSSSRAGSRWCNELQT